MKGDSSPYSSHLSGEQSLIVAKRPPEGVDLDSFFGPVRVEWDHEAAMTPLGQLPFFVDFLKTAGLFDALVADCPLRYLSPNAPKRRDVLGTVMLSMLAGHRRYAHIAALRCDAVLPELLGMKKIVSEDAIRRAFKAIDETEGAVWLRRHLQYCVEPLLAEPWILDVDTTIKPLYGHQEGAVLGYNPKKPGRPSHCYHTYSMASTRLVLDVDVGPGDEHASQHSGPSLWGLLDRLPRDLWPALLRGDRGFGNEGIMREAEARELPFLLKLRLTANVKRMIEKLASTREWVDAGQGFEAKESEVRLVGWSRRRRVIVLRRRLKDAVGLGRLYDARSCPLPTRGAAACAHLQLVEHLRPARRSPPPSRGDHQPSPVPDGDRHPHPSCAANDDPRDELARQGRARRPGACGRRRLPAGPGQKCGAVDPPANMASDLVARLPGIPQRPPPPRPAPPRAKLMQPKREKSLTPKRHIGQLPFLGSSLRPNEDPFFGKADIYHAVQACLIPLLPTTGTITRGLVTQGASAIC